MRVDHIQNMREVHKHVLQNVVDLKSTIELREGEIARLKSKVKDLTFGLNKSEKELSDLKAKNEALKKKVGKLRKETKALTTALNKANKAIETLEAKLEAQNNQEGQEG